MICFLYGIRFKLTEIKILTCYFTEQAFFSERVKENIFFVVVEIDLVMKGCKEISQDAFVE